MGTKYACPRCGGQIPNEMMPGAYPGAISRVDNKTEVCSACGYDEAMRDFNQQPLQQISDWPISKIEHRSPVTFIEDDESLLLKFGVRDSNKSVSVYTVERSAMSNPGDVAETIQVSETEMAILFPNDWLDGLIQHFKEEQDLSDQEATSHALGSVMFAARARAADFLGLNSSQI